MGYICLFQFWFPRGICLGVGLLGHMVVLFLVFLGNLHTIFHSGCINHSSILAWRIPWTEEPGRFRGSQRVRHDLVTEQQQQQQQHTHTHTHTESEVSLSCPTLLNKETKCSESLEKRASCSFSVGHFTVDNVLFVERKTFKIFIYLFGCIRS